MIEAPASTALPERDRMPAPERVWLQEARDGLPWHEVGPWNEASEGDGTLYVRADLASAPQPEGERAVVAAALRFLETFGSHRGLVLGIIAAAGELPRFHEGPFQDGFRAGLEEVAARADAVMEDGNPVLLSLVEAICDLVTGQAVLVHGDPSDFKAALAALGAQP